MRAPPAPLPDLAFGPAPDPGRPDELFEGLVRVTAPNPGMMTGPGTNTYLVGRDELAVVDPGPDDERHRDALLAEAGRRGRIRWVLVTHTHPDHAPGAQSLAERTGAEVVGFCAREGFLPDVVAGDGWSLRLDPAGPLRLTALHTPGHASDHLCWVVDGPGDAAVDGPGRGGDHESGPGRVVLSGDHVMEGSTVVVRPPDGDMTAYLESLQSVQDLDPPAAVVAPGHGRLIGQVPAAIGAVVAHRLEREQAVAGALTTAGMATVDQLLPAVYGDVDASRLRVARFSLWAHLRRLASLGHAVFELDAGGSEPIATAAAAPSPLWGGGAGGGPVAGQEEPELTTGRWRWLGD